ncbi:M48 family metallopeptidase [Nostoc sp. 'Lobaria pulmonaria (5183) cyanobiont']|uniref:M48 family metallopeptidase n=1 Tax=Nostoc sp. 'Lobaria pulmonaria (5183) cyanobiont' TaxID=1618022 RepID=UPI000CF31C8C|nr:M48 family metallopeptidase [Nostoc sp. 'Lobaria pulmonaria (5183) cyanobiont']AVH74002.1 peptidase M48/Zn-dependent protease with chaperone function [Nostoc sp. 'Lobaria pulmonaria (5183) cyanobiont']
MAFNQDPFDKLIQKLEAFANKQPHLYKLHVAFLATLGYAYIFLVLAVTLALLAGIIFLMLNAQSVNAFSLKGVLFLLAFALVLLRSLWVSFPPPTGLPLQPKDVPNLYSLINEISSKLQAPRFHHILLTNDFNAGVVQRPRLGLLGWQQNYLIVGLPLMLALPPEQFRAVLAHELGHLSGNHSRFSGWIYRQRETWYRIIKGLRQGGNEVSSLIFDRFLTWYSPFFNAYSFVLARMDEYEADRCAVELSGEQNAAEALINVEVKARFIERYFWSSIYKQVETEIEPPKMTYMAMQQALSQRLHQEITSSYLMEALTKKTNNADTHPCLTDRLKALGYIFNPQQELAIFAPIEISAAQKLLGNRLEKLIAHFSQAWREEIATPWRQKYADFQQSIATLKDLNQKAKTQQLTLDEATQRAFLIFKFDGEEAVIPLLQEIIHRDAHHASANYLLGQILLNKQDTTGIEYIEKAMDKDSSIVIEGCQIICYFLHQQGKINEVKSYQKRVENYYELILKAGQERSHVRGNDKFESHTVSDIEVNKLRQQLSHYPQVISAYLVQKNLQYFPEKPFYILALKRKVTFLEGIQEPDHSKLINSLLQENEFLGNVFIFILNNHLNMEKKLKRIPNSMIYQKKGKK